MAIEQTGSVQRFAFSGSGQTGNVSTTITVPADAEIVVASVSKFIGFVVGGLQSMTFTKGGSQVAMTKVTGGDTNGSTWNAALFYLVAPDTGANKTLAWSWSQVADDASNLFTVTFWKGIDTAAPVRDSDGGQNGTFPSDSLTLDAQTGDLLLAYVGFTCDAESTVTSLTNLTILENLTFTAGYSDGALMTASPSGSTTISVDSSVGGNPSEPSLVALVLKPPSGPAAEAPTLHVIRSGIRLN